MVDILNLVLLKKYEESNQPENAVDSINHWLQEGKNYQRLQQECEKIWLHYIQDEKYQAERAFKILGQRLHGICQQEMGAISPRDNR